MGTPRSGGGAAARQMRNASPPQEGEATAMLLLQMEHRATSRCKILGVLAMVEAKGAKLMWTEAWRDNIGISGGLGKKKKREKRQN
jgi:hypothetical protein